MEKAYHVKKDDAVKMLLCFRNTRVPPRIVPFQFRDDLTVGSRTRQSCNEDSLMILGGLCKGSIEVVPNPISVRWEQKLYPPIKRATMSEIT